MSENEMRLHRPRRFLGYWLRRIADRVDWWGAPRAIGWSFTFETGKGLVWHECRDVGCPVWFIGYDQYERAHRDSGPTSETQKGAPQPPGEGWLRGGGAGPRRWAGARSSGGGAAWLREDRTVSDRETIRAELDRLVGLGSVERIAADLGGRGVVGDPGLHSCHPIAVHMNAVLGEEAATSFFYGEDPVGGDTSAYVLFDDPTEERGVGKLPMPPLVEEFMAAFDQGEFADLTDQDDLD